MRSLFDRSVLLYSSIDNRSVFRGKIADRARRIAEALSRAADAAYEMNVAGVAKTRAEASGTDRARELTERQLKLAMLSHLKECASVAIEMQQAVSDVLTGWVLSDDVAGTGLGREELRALLDVAGYNS